MLNYKCCFVAGAIHGVQRPAHPRETEQVPRRLQGGQHRNSKFLVFIYQVLRLILSQFVTEHSIE
jgi:hypothetical protein